MKCFWASTDVYDVVCRTAEVVPRINDRGRRWRRLQLLERGGDEREDKPDMRREKSLLFILSWQ
jgi:hypothetical protein